MTKAATYWFNLSLFIQMNEIQLWCWDNRVIIVIVEAHSNIHTHTHTHTCRNTQALMPDCKWLTRCAFDDSSQRDEAWMENVNFKPRLNGITQESCWGVCVCVCVCGHWKVDQYICVAAEIRLSVQPSSNHTHACKIAYTRTQRGLLA